MRLSRLFFCLGIIAIFLCDPRALGQLALTVDSNAESQRRTDWFMRGRSVPGQSAALLRLQAHQQRMAMRANRATVTDVITPHIAPTGAVWTSIGPAPLVSDPTGLGQQDYGWVSGRATAVAIDPADATGNTVYLGAAFGGVWKSSNAGSLSSSPSSVVWKPLTDNQATLAVGAIAIQSGNSDPSRGVVLVGTGEANSSADSYYGLGILRSPDGGATWNLIQTDSSKTRSFAGLGFSKIAFSTVNPNLVVAGTVATAQGIFSGLENPLAANRGIYFSNDAGQAWTYASVTDGNAAIPPESVTSIGYNSGAARFFAAIRAHGLYSSPDGMSWTRLANQPGAGLSAANCPVTPQGSCPIYRGEIAVVPGRNEMYVWYVDANENDQGIWQTTNGGTSWTPISTAGIESCGDTLGCGTEQGSYNLELAAVPNGGTTDLYAGAINLYKCTLAPTVPDCSGAAPNTFLNLTHVYGCAPNLGSTAHVHPNQHSLDFAVFNNRATLYFANDGGVYRSLDGYTGLATGTCGGTNQFDSLNQTLGSLSQFISFSQHPSDADTLLGGAQGNGSPATASAQSSTAWFEVNAGDGGFTAINPSNPLEWFTANTDVSIQRCANGSSCRAADYSLVADSVTMDGDHGAFFTPYILDPQATSSELIVGTCRVWRGPGSGRSFAPLSDSFEFGAGSCSGNEINLVRSLAAGGPTDANGFSNVIWAGTDGYGPLLSTTGGHVWNTTDAASGPGTWVDRTSTINPSGYPISSIAIDSSDATGHTAYVSIMGFHASHVWKTTTAGTLWTDFTGSGSSALPDAPANVIVVDSQSKMLYVGTDVGVFSTSTTSPAWSEVGPVNGTGFLPNVAITGLKIFNTGGVKRLRASTYGRGMWQSTLSSGPDYQVSIPASSQTIFVGQTSTFSGTVAAFNNYSNTVTLTCAASTTQPPSTCTISPSQFIPAAAGTSFTVTASGATGDYVFRIHGVGNDANRLSHDVVLTLHIAVNVTANADFLLTLPSPFPDVKAGGRGSGPISVTSQDGFSGTVTLSCASPCSVSPASVSAYPAYPATATVTVDATNLNSSSTYSASVTATSGSITHSLSVPVNITDYQVTAITPSQTAPGQTATSTLTFVPVNSYSGTINVICDVSALPAATCSLSPSGPISISSAQTSVTASISVPGGTPAGNYTINCNTQDVDGTPKHSTSISLPVGSDGDFMLVPLVTSQTIPAGQTAQFSVAVSPSGAAYNSAVSLSCSGLPALSNCSFSPNPVTPGNATASVGLSLTTTAPVAASLRERASSMRALRAAWLVVSGLLLPFGFRTTQRHNRPLIVLAVLGLLIFLVILQAACGGGLNGGSGGGGGTGGGGSGQPGTPRGTYTITVNAVSGQLSHSTQFTLVVQ